MERDMFRVPEDMISNADNPMVIDGVASTSNSVIQSNLFNFNKQDQINAVLPLLSTMQGGTVSGFDNNHQISASMTGADYSAMASRPMLGMTVARDSYNSSCQSEDSNLTGHHAGGILIPAASLATLLTRRNSLHNDLNNAAIPRPSMVAPDSSRNFASYGGFSTQSSSHSILAGETFTSTRLPSSLFAQNVDTDKSGFSRVANAGVDQQNTSSNYHKDLSLSLVSSLPFLYGTKIKDHGSDTFYSGGSHNNFNDTGFGSEKNSCHSTESVGANKHTQFSHIVPGSIYLRVMQEILAQIAAYSLETLDISQISYLPSGAEVGNSSQRHGREKSSYEFSDTLKWIEVQTDHAERHSSESKKAQLLALLQVVDDCYNQCVDEMHTVVSAFHAATELDPNIHACFALHNLSSMYKDLRERISKQILAIGATLHGLYPREERSPETLCNERQWELLQLKRKDHQLWKPQRGLPDRSVSVLKAWMFQNFLHPYPKDSEKHILAIKSGLTRSQVSNWFINARVRIWKPLIEEMYSEMNKRKARQNEGANSNYQCNMNTGNYS